MTEAFPKGTCDERRALAWLFVHNIEAHPATGEVFIHMWCRLTAPAKEMTPSKMKKGSPYEAVAGAGFWRLLILVDEPVIEIRRGSAGEVVMAGAIRWEPSSR